MLRFAVTGIGCVLLAASFAAFAELQEVRTGGLLRIRGIYQGGLIPNSDNFVAQRTRLHAHAVFSENVSAFIEFDAYNAWGEDFRSDYLAGLDRRPADGNGVNVYQAYVNIEEIAGTPLHLRLGRQEIVLGDGWLIGNNEDKLAFTGLSFDAAHLTYVTEKVTAGALYARLAQGPPMGAEGSVDLYSAYVNYTPGDPFSLLGYWIFIHDAFQPAPGFDTTNLHTIGFNASGETGRFDYTAEAAYQFGEAERAGFDFDDSNASFDNWAATAEVGYTFEGAWEPRLSLGADYFGGEDRRDEPGRASVSFNRLFSNVEYVYLDSTELSNCWLIHAGVEAAPLEKWTISATLYHLEAVDNGVSGSGDLGWETGLLATYEYSKDLAFEMAWYHWFRGSGVEDGLLAVGNGFDTTDGCYADHVDYFYIEAKVTF
ncbi:MAG TPA: alginate export family protein [Candidatus Hydrogenedentes bacterium]|nr:alginate export family protein [Candidatus Hydrogenedentota bacterium]HOV73898.1 alginate export family protein [Candidatus Hydrogenedentota bacterium]HPC14880.1 alginate export family protein [Candidatus Hydrogenedentota bacterium]HRT18744.1 alginate export family protein [Candidatus Hydrogenedentota bacterium]HRT63764.1 alginate export family protein [Candidatus Hydrogenedentota bacterium]